jgi:hypothetical protein
MGPAHQKDNYTYTEDQVLVGVEDFPFSVDKFISHDTRRKNYPGPKGKNALIGMQKNMDNIVHYIVYRNAMSCFMTTIITKRCGKSFTTVLTYKLLIGTYQMIYHNTLFCGEVGIRKIDCY